MKKTIQLLFFSFLSTLSFAQEWHYELDNVSQQLFPFTDLSKTSDGYVMIHGNNIIEFNDLGELKYDYETQIWSFLAKNSFIHKLTDGYLVVGFLKAGGTSKTSIYKVGFDNQLIYSLDLNTVSGSFNYDKFPAAAYKPQSEELFVGTHDSLYAVNIVNGQVLWRTFHSGEYTDGIVDVTSFVTVSKSGGLVHCNSSGNINWASNLNFNAYTVEKTSNGYIVGGTNTNGISQIVFTDGAGVSQSVKNYSNGIIQDIKATPDGDFILSGEDNNQPFLIKIDATGNLIWQKYYGTGEGQKVELTNDGGYLMYVQEPAQLIKTDKNGNTAIDKQKFFVDGHQAINISNIATVFSAKGNMFHYRIDSYMDAPKGGNVGSIFSGGLWIGGKDPNNTLRLSIQTYDGDYESGFINSNPLLSNKVWKINREDLIDFKNDISDGTADYPIPHHILTYPAKGNPYLKGKHNLLFNLTKDAAPFVDINNDGIYNVYDGDYPVMKGDEMLIWLMNDDIPHGQSQGIGFQVDILATVYGYKCLDNTDINNNLFVNYKIINQSLNDFNDVFLGVFNDFDLGCHTDDYLGVDTASHTTYVYNEKHIDSQSGCVGASYGSNIPVQSMTFLNLPMNSSLYNFNGGGNFYGSTSGSYNALQGIWANGTIVTTGGNGFQSGGNPTTYTFTGNPSDPNSWNMCTFNLLTGGFDIRGLSSSGPYNLAQGGIIDLEMAFTIHPDVPHPCPDISANVISKINSMKDYYDNDELNWEINLGSDQTLAQGTTITLDPNFANGTSYVWSTGANTPTIDVSSLGSYHVTVTHTNGCKKTDSIQITGLTSTNEIVENIKTKLYPNPAKDYFQVDFDIDLNVTQLNFEITNAIGQTLKSKTSNLSNGQMTFDTSDLPTGVYFLNIKNQELHLKTLKVIVE